MTKRWIALLLTLMLVAAAFAGCGAKQETTADGADGKIIIKYWAHQNEGWNKSHNDIAARFNASQDRIEVQTEFFPYDDFEAKTQTSLIAKSGGADIYEIWGGWAADFAPTGALCEVSEVIATQIEEDYLPPTYGTFTHEGKYYGVPLEFNIESGGLLVNKAQFDARGLAYPTTWEEMITIAEETSESDGVTMQMRGFDFVTWDNVMYTWLSMILSAGGSYWNEDGTFNFTSPLAVSTMEELVSYVVDKQFTNCDALTGGGDNEGHFNLYEDRAMMVVRGPWVIAEGVEIYEKELGNDIDYIGMPWYGDEIAFAAETGWGLAVSSSSPHQAEAWEFIEFMTREENLVPHLIACGLLPARESMLDNATYREAMPHVLPLLEILPYGQYLGYFNTDILKENINNMFVEFCTTDARSDVAGKLADLETRMNAELLDK